MYTLASREGALELKCQIIEKYKGETKAEVLYIIRDTFPLPVEDKRKGSFEEEIIATLTKIKMRLEHRRGVPTKNQKKIICDLLDKITILITEL